MVKFWIISGILISLLFLAGVVSAEGNIAITSSPTGASITIDDSLLDVITPITLSNVSNGPHTLLFHYVGYTDTWANITVTGDQTVSVTLAAIVTTTATSVPEVNGTIRIESSPSGANAYLNSVLQGYTPITLRNITPDRYTVTVQKPGYHIYTKTFNATAGNQSYLNAYLDAEATDTPTTATTVTPRKTSTLKTYTPWLPNTPTQSPLPVWLCIGAIGLGFLLIRKR